MSAINSLKEKRRSEQNLEQDIHGRMFSEKSSLTSLSAHSCCCCSHFAFVYIYIYRFKYRRSSLERQQHVIQEAVKLDIVIIVIISGYHSGDLDKRNSGSNSFSVAVARLHHTLDRWWRRQWHKLVQEVLSLGVQRSANQRGPALFKANNQLVIVLIGHNANKQQQHNVSS